MNTSHEQADSYGDFSLDPASGSGSQERGKKNSQFKWTLLLKEMQQDQSLVTVLSDNMNKMFISKNRLLKQTKLNPRFRALIEKYDPKNCIKALSVVCDLTFLKRNQYKFMYQKLSLGRATRLLIKESFYLKKTLQMTQQRSSHFPRLVTGWVEFLFIIHDVPDDVRKPLLQAIFEHIDLLTQNLNQTGY